MPNLPTALSSAEIREIAAIEDVRHTWGVRNATEMAKLFNGRDIHAWKFSDVITDIPGCSGELFILVGNDWGPPLRLVRVKGKLVVIYKWEIERQKFAGMGGTARGKKLSKKRRSARHRSSYDCTIARL